MVGRAAGGAEATMLSWSALGRPPLGTGSAGGIVPWKLGGGQKAAPGEQGMPRQVEHLCISRGPQEET